MKAIKNIKERKNIYFIGKSSYKLIDIEMLPSKTSNNNVQKIPDPSTINATDFFQMKRSSLNHYQIQQFL